MASGGALLKRVFGGGPTGGFGPSLGPPGHSVNGRTGGNPVRGMCGKYPTAWRGLGDEHFLRGVPPPAGDFVLAGYN